MSGKKKYVISRQHKISNLGYDGVFWLLKRVEDHVILQDVDEMMRIITVPHWWIKEAYVQSESEPEEDGIDWTEWKEFGLPGPE